MGVKEYKGSIAGHRWLLRKNIGSGGSGGGFGPEDSVKVLQGGVKGFEKVVLGRSSSETTTTFKGKKKSKKSKKKQLQEDIESLVQSKWKLVLFAPGGVEGEVPVVKDVFPEIAWKHKYGEEGNEGRFRDEPVVACFVSYSVDVAMENKVSKRTGVVTARLYFNNEQVGRDVELGGGGSGARDILVSLLREKKESKYLSIDDDKGVEDL